MNNVRFLPTGGRCAKRCRARPSFGNSEYGYYRRDIATCHINMLLQRPWRSHVTKGVHTLANNVVFFDGTKMPIIGLGTWQSSVDEVSSAVDKALEIGYRHLDTAYSYQNEAAIGKTLKKWFDLGNLKREDLFITTKLPAVGNRAECVEKYLKRSLEALQLRYVDLYLIHQPCGHIERGEELWPMDENKKFLLDMNTDHISLWKAMETQVDAGRARSIGLSNFNSDQIKKIVKASRIQPANVQVELHLYFQQKELAAFCRALDITLCAYAPLGSPGLMQFLKKSGREFSNVPPLSPLADPVVGRIAEKYKKTPSQVLLRHIMQREIMVIPKSTNGNRIQENFKVFDFNLSEAEMLELNALDKGPVGRLFGHGLGYERHPEYTYRVPY